MAIACSLALVLVASLLVGCIKTSSPIPGAAIFTGICAGNLNFDDIAIYGDEACLNPALRWSFGGIPAGSSYLLPFTVFLRIENKGIAIDSIKVADTFEHGTVTMQYVHCPYNPYSSFLPGKVASVQLTIHVDRGCPPEEHPLQSSFRPQDISPVIKLVPGMILAPSSGVEAERKWRVKSTIRQFELRQPLVKIGPGLLNSLKIPFLARAIIK